jgi:hypothetical protein
MDELPIIINQIVKYLCKYFTTFLFKLKLNLESKNVKEFIDIGLK